MIPREELLDRTIPLGAARAIKFLESITESYDLDLPDEHRHLCAAIRQLGNNEHRLVRMEPTTRRMVQIWRVR